MTNKQKYLYIAIVVVVVLLYGVLSFFLFSSPTDQTKQKKIIPTPTKVASSPLDKVQKEAKEGTPLSSKEITLREQLISEADVNTGQIYKEDTFSFVYLSDFDTFQIRILSSDIDETENKATLWLKEQGFSQNGICKLPVFYYISPRLLGDTLANPIPKECQE